MPGPLIRHSLKKSQFQPFEGCSDVDGVTAGLFGRFVNRFAECGMSVDGRDKFLVGCFHLDGQTEFGDHFGGVGTEDVGAEDLSVRFAENDFDEAFTFTHGKGFAAGHERKFTDFVFEAFFFRCPFGQPDAGHLRFAVGAAREDIHFARGFTGEHTFDCLDGLEAGHVGEPWWPDDIAGGKDTTHRSLVAVVGLDPAFRVEFDF